MATLHTYPDPSFSNQAPPNRRGQELRWPASMIWRTGEPAVNSITVSDLKDAVSSGISDFTRVPSHALFLVLLYPVIGIVLSRLLFGYEMMPLIFPLAAGFALIGPAAAIGLYQLSKRREQGQDLSVWHLFEVFNSPSIGAIARLSLLLFALFAAWLMLAQLIYHQTMGATGYATFGDFIHDVANTPRGRTLMFAGNAVGFLFAVVVLVISTVSFPMLVDRNISMSTAVRTSVRAFLHNPVTMALWGLFVAAALAIGMLPMFVGLALVLPVLGHATWHLYRKLVSFDRTYRDDAI